MSSTAIGLFRILGIGAASALVFQAGRLHQQAVQTNAAVASPLSAAHNTAALAFIVGAATLYSWNDPTRIPKLLGGS